MDQEKIGLFIRNLRKQHNMTQKELGEKVGVSDKTISKWENGINMPDMSCLPLLCEILETNVNELISGEHFPPELYETKAEDNLMGLLDEKKKLDKKRLLIDLSIGFTLLVSSVFLLLTSIYGITFHKQITGLIDITSLVVILVFTTAVAFLGRPRSIYGFFTNCKKNILFIGTIVFVLTAINALNSNESNALAVSLSYAAIPILYSLTIYVLLNVLLSHKGESKNEN